MRPRRPVTSRQTVFRTPNPPNKRRLSVDRILKAAHLLGSGSKIRDVAHEVDCSASSVHTVKQRATGCVVTLTEYEYDRCFLAHFVAFCLFQNPQATGRSITEQARKIGLETSVTSVNRVAFELNFRSVMPQKQEKLTQTQKDYRVTFCNDIRLWFGYCLPWVFTDESMLVLNPLKKKLRVIRGVDAEEKFVDVTGYPAKVMVWAAVGRNFKSPLVRVTGTLTASEYQKLLSECKIFELLDERYGKFAYVFQQDGARPHTAVSTRDFLREKAVTLPPECHWPACSPDLNIIENLWSILKSSMRYDQMLNADAMFSEAVRVWDSISLETINKLVDDFSCRLETCLAIRGEPINRYKQVLRGFRISEAEGRQALYEMNENCEKICRFKEASEHFFAVDMQKFTPWSKLPGNQPDRRTLIARNEHLWMISAGICLGLPNNVLTKSRLPFSPLGHEKLVRADQGSRAPRENDDL